ncbi:hypothetical protein [Paenilisteria rocourtiae]|uniref:Uncharacterized protein n=1 Tax=Listeria rocourtiae TaxID=647910 RepID=A0A4R6ZRG6_9LIST|nr:hypothetical protein [Listeria rocourtiae]EUJ44395.1 hypothetical protein PROCOU_13868 [Listeria rocourtiae FSL F6-920]TDR55125.1 hypothetical protein DFP96_10153 [Listeria rocourtiae]
MLSKTYSDDELARFFIDGHGNVGLLCEDGKVRPVWFNVAEYTSILPSDKVESFMKEVTQHKWQQD